MSFIDVVKGIEMFDELKVPTIGVIENMSYFMCNKCDVKHKIFGMGYVDVLKKQFGIQVNYIYIECLWNCYDEHNIRM